MEHLSLTLCARDVYGEFKFYPVDKTAHLFADLLHQKTLTLHDLKYIMALGYTVNFDSEANTQRFKDMLTA